MGEGETSRGGDSKFGCFRKPAGLTLIQSRVQRRKRNAGQNSLRSDKNMAKKKVRRKTTATAAKNETVKLSTKDKRTLKAIRGMADGLVQTANRKRAPHLDIPSRSLGNVRRCSLLPTR